MIRSFRQLAVAAVAVGAVSGAFAAQTTVEFKTFYDTSTILNLTDKKTLNYSVATLKLVDIAGGGVKGTLTFNDTDFPAGSKGLAVDELWLASSSTVKGAVSASSGTALTGTYYKSGFYQEGTKYNYDLQYKANTFAEGATSQFTISGVTVASFLSSATAVKGIGLEITGIGKQYSGLFGLNNAVRFIGTVAVPEPSTYALMGLGLVGIAFTARKRKAA